MIPEEKAKQLVREWGRRFDEHLGLSGFLDILAEDGLLMKFGENAWRGLAGFEDHLKLKTKFFDEAHVYDESGWDIEVGETETKVRSKMMWACRTREDFAPRSQELCADLEHRWVMVTCPRRGIPVIQYHECVSLKYRPGQGPDGDHVGDVHLDH
ncbi:hypothetical protein [Cerasicoccus maritimus]|uniref:hypothetical protein n=1 Tax=Cerasicoccus maritimus TaxID=490089 RepID=UPI0028527CD5|nr:hypothetical protein [Cerasicoccus maritimus]